MTSKGHRASISVALVRDALAGAAKAGLAIGELLRDSGMPPDLLNRTDALVTLDQFVALHRLVCSALNDEYIGLLHKAQRIGTIHKMGQLAVHSKTVGEAMAKTSEFYNLFENSFLHMVERDGRTARYILSFLPGQTVLNSYATELFFCEIHRFYSWLLGDRILIEDVEFTSPRDPNKSSVYPHFFFGGRMRFEQGRNAIGFSAEYLDQPVTKTEIDLASWIARSPIDLFLPAHTFGHHSLSVRNILAGMIGLEWPRASLTHVSAILHMHPQTLRRQLKTEKSSFRALKDQVLRDTAIQLLTNTNAQVQEISEQLGYSEPSAFNRAFHNLTGRTPQTYRRQALRNR